MSLEKYVREKLQRKSTLLMTHAVVGYPSFEDNWRMLECMQEAGVDLVELQMPFSEPIADGPRFVKANQEALDHGLCWNQYFNLVERAAQTFDFPILFMGYYNSIYRMGHEAFCERLKSAGGCGYIVADLPPEEAGDLNAIARKSDLDPVLLMTPTNSDQRLKEIAAMASGFLYCVARKGVTGKQTDLAVGVEEFIGRCRQATPLPLALGFGVKTASDVAVAGRLADIAIVGTACLEAWESLGEEGYRGLLNELVGATGKE